MFEGRYHIRTFGCQMNEVDSETAADVLESLGYHRTFDPQEADVLLVNTCSVRDKAEHKAYSEVGRLAKIKAARPNIKVGVMGWVPEMKTHQFGKFPFVDFLIGAKERNPRQRLLEALGVDPATAPAAKTAADVSMGLTVVRGCSYYCTFCIVPFVRGHEDSVPMEEILQQVRRAAGHGAREFTLLGQNVLWYGRDLEGVTFLDLLKAVCEEEGVERVRFLTSHPNDLTEELVAYVAENPRCYTSFHLPIQSGSETMLTRMNRRGTAAEYREKVAMVRRYCPTASISTDLIAGFPGETEEDHQATLTLMRDIAWDSAFVFAYSPRQGTPAAKRPPAEEVPVDVAKSRVQDLLAAQQEIAAQKWQGLLGQRGEVFLSRKEKDGRLVGHTRDYRKVLLAHPTAQPGQTLTVTLKTQKPWGFLGEAEDLP